MTIETRIVALLRERPDGVDDDEVARLLALKARQQANSRCRMLEEKGIVTRQRVDGKIRNFWTGTSAAQPLVLKQARGDEGVRPWFWEGNVQAAIVRYLASEKYDIRSVANTSTREQGVDIVADRNGKALWVSVKGYPEGTARTNPSLQAGHWFKQVVFDMLVYRGQDDTVSLGVGLPDYPRYRSMSTKIDWVRRVGRFSYFWVQENGEVTIA